MSLTGTAASLAKLAVSARFVISRSMFGMVHWWHRVVLFRPDSSLDLVFFIWSNAHSQVQPVF